MHDPYIGLWSRLADFRHEDLTALIVERTSGGSAAKPILAAPGGGGSR